MRLGRDFFARDVLRVAPDLLGKVLVRRFEDGRELKLAITEVEAYRGMGDQACHARFGKTERNKVMWERAGLVYVYLIYGMYWMLNLVTGKEGEPQAVLIRGLEGVVPKSIEGSRWDGPGKVGKLLKLDKIFYGEDVATSGRLWVEEDNVKERFFHIMAMERVGVEYAGEWARKKWRWKVVRSKG